MRFNGRFKLLTIKPDKFVHDFFWFITDMAARYFVQGLIGSDLTPAWTGQLRASLTKAARLVRLSINYSDVVEPNREGKNVGTGVGQGTARWIEGRGIYGFEFTSSVADLNSDPSHNYWEENEYDRTHANRIRQTPWGSIEEAGLATEAYIRSTIAPMIRDFFKHDIYIRSEVTV